LVGRAKPRSRLPRYFQQKSGVTGFMGEPAALKS
jgi:hypothetical protein